jgi:hypothetical protein
MHRLLVQGGPSPVVRAPVALALVKLLRLLPLEAERTELPRALQVCAFTCCCIDFLRAS